MLTFQSGFPLNYLLIAIKHIKKQQLIAVATGVLAFGISFKGGYV